MDTVLLACDHYNLDDCFKLAVEFGLGLEVQTFAYPTMLDEDLDERVNEYKTRLQGFDRPLAMHGAFLDMASASLDPKVVAVARERYTKNIEIAAEVGASLVVFHANYLTNIRTEPFRRAWTQRQIDFWNPMAELAANLDVRIAIENMWEYEPCIIADVLREVNSPYLVSCLDTSHAHLYGEVPFREWLDELGEFIQHIHLNNTGGVADDHRALDDGVMDYAAILPQLRALPNQVVFSLEMTSTTAMRHSLPFFDLDQQVATIP